MASHFLFFGGLEALSWKKKKKKNSSDGASVQVVNDNSTEEKKLESKIKSLKGMLDKILQAWERSCSKRKTTRHDAKLDSNGPIMCWSCGEEGHVKRFCKKKTKAESSNANYAKNKGSEN